MNMDTTVKDDGILLAFIESEKIDPRDIARSLNYKTISAVTRYLEHDGKHKLRLQLLLLAVCLSKKPATFDMGGLKIQATIEKETDIVPLMDAITASTIEQDGRERKRLKNLVSWKEIGEKAGCLQSFAYKMWAEWRTLQIFPIVMEATKCPRIEVSHGKSTVTVSIPV